MKRTLKRIFICGLIAILVVVATISIIIGLTYLFSNKVKFDINKIKYSSTYVEMYDKNNCPIKD